MLTKPLPGVMDDPFHPLSQGCVCHLLFNEGAGNLAYDVSGNGNHGTLKNMLPNTQGSKWQGSKFGGGLAFDGGDDYVDCGSGTSLNITETWTISMWLFPRNVTLNKYALEKYERKYAILLGYQDNHVNFYHGVYEPDAASTQIPISINEWCNIVYTKDRNGMSNNWRGYTNGVEQFSLSHDFTLTTSASMLAIGARGDGEGGNSANTIFDEVLIYNRALSAEEVKQLYYDPFCNLIQVPAWQLYSPTAPAGAIMNQFQRANLGADLYDGVLIT